MYTNMDNHGGNFGNILNKEFTDAKDVIIATGYTSLDTLQKYHDRFIEVAQSGGVSKLLLGMALYEGLREKKLNAIESLNTQLVLADNASGVYVTNGRRFHGKVYYFNNGQHSKFYVGSSNFSSSGLNQNIECMLAIESTQQKKLLSIFLHDLYANHSIKIDRAEIPILNPGKKLFLNEVEDHWNSLQRYEPASIDIQTDRKLSISLSKLAEKEKSNLNVYFGKGRLNRSTGRI